MVEPALLPVVGPPEPSLPPVAAVVVEPAPPVLAPPAGAPLELPSPAPLDGPLSSLSLDAPPSSPTQPDSTEAMNVAVSTMARE
ncbi:hypothetical protein BE15_31375 [Sorangium cellulosum]|uniref:Uncharacterized protein n=1 Tax=Sorangium cellulosum TaxID=56 RepID=A0A150QL02_SORCE|nr:hypothetical protein BE15_31375 [Sorangium cellulosum]